MVSRRYQFPEGAHPVWCEKTIGDDAGNHIAALQAFSPWQFQVENIQNDVAVIGDKIFP